MAYDDRKRYNLRMSRALAKFFEDRAAATGQSVGACMCLALMEYVEQKKGVEAVAGIVHAYEQEQGKQATQAAQKPAQ